MADRWTTEDIARELGLRSPAVARSSLRRWRLAGIYLDVEIDPITGVKRYLPDQIRAAHALRRQGARTDLTKENPRAPTTTSGPKMRYYSKSSRSTRLMVWNTSSGPTSWPLRR